MFYFVHLWGLGLTRNSSNSKSRVPAQSDQMLSLANCVNSTHSRSLSRMNLMKKYSDKIICYNKYVGYDKYQHLIDLISQGQYQTARKRPFAKPQSVVRSLNDFYYQDFRRQLPKRKRRFATKVPITLQSSENFINCLELNSYVENTTEYVFLHKNIDLHTGSRDCRDLNHLLRKQYLISSVIANPEIVSTRPMISNNYLESFLRISDKEIKETSYGDNVTELGENCQVYIKLVYEDLTIKITENRSIYSINDVNTFPRFYWPVLEIQKFPLKYFTKSIEIQTLSDNSTEINARIFLSLQTISDILFFSVDEMILDFLNKSVVRYEHNNLKYYGDCNYRQGQKYNVVEEDYLIIYESDTEYLKELNLSTVLSQPFESTHIKDYQMISPNSGKCQLNFQEKISIKSLSQISEISALSSSFPLNKIYRTCLKVFRLPVVKSDSLLNETEFTLELNLNNEEERRILKFLNVPIMNNRQETLEFFISSFKCQEIVILIKDESISCQKGKENCILIHKVMENSTFHNFFNGKYRIDNYLNETNRKMYFFQSSESPFWLLRNLWEYFSLIRLKNNWKNIENLIKKDLNLSKICLHRIYFYKESFEFLKSLSKSVA